jgi:putative hydrolase of the HAD superfamily
MPSISTIFWDIGGVLLNNAWDHDERDRALVHFAIDAADFAARHEKLAPAFERGDLTLEAYLDQTIFHTPRKFTKEDFREFMFALSKPIPEALEFARELARTGKYLMATLNNESRELNDYRIKQFGLRDIFRVFVSSCFVGLRKPDEAIYKLALDLTQASPANCCFIDDRKANLEAPARLGMHVIQMQNVEQLRHDLALLGVAANRKPASRQIGGIIGPY